MKNIAPTRATTLPNKPQARKEYPVGTGVLDYFPDALVAVSNVSFKGNQQHNPGQPLHWERSKSTDQADTIIRHFLQRGSLDSDGSRHSAKLAWRALASLQLEIEADQKTIAARRLKTQRKNNAQRTSRSVDDGKLNDLRAKLSARYSSEPEFADAASTAVSSTQLYGKPESVRASYCQGHPDSIGE